jgi:integrase
MLANSSSRVNAVDLSTAAKRSRLKPRPGNPYWVRIGAHGSGQALGYYKGAAGGRWVAKLVQRGRKKTLPLGVADDAEDGVGMTYDAALRAAMVGFEKLNVEAGCCERLTLELVRDAYLADLKSRGGNTKDAHSRWAHVPNDWLARDPSSIEPDEWRRWRDRLPLTPAGKNRTTATIKAALAYACNQYPDLAAPAVRWKTALAKVAGADQARHVALGSSDIRSLLAAARNIDADFHVLCVLAACTGARYGQLTRITVGDLEVGGRIVRIPRSAKGRNGAAKKDRWIAVPIPPDVCALLANYRANRDPSSPLLLRTVRTPAGGTKRRGWAHAEQVPFIRQASQAALGRKIEFSTFRHSYICAALARNVPIRVVAAICDTSSDMIERNYSAHILDATVGLIGADQIDLGLGDTNLIPSARLVS